MEIRKCMNCMNELQTDSEVCPVCGYDNRQTEQPAFAMPCGFILHGRYLIGKVLGQGGFGITYIGLDMVLDTKVAVKEYYPMGMVTREQGKSASLLWNLSQISQTQRQSAYDSFLKEARKMAKLEHIPSIVRVRDMFLENETAYLVMDYIEGTTLKAKIKRDGQMSFGQCVSLLRPMMEGLVQVHRYGMIHRDISPDNIMIQPDGRVRLLDLGAAKDMTVGNALNSQLVAKKGFTPLEQYAENGKIGPWTDVYAMSATIYYAVTGKLLPESVERVMGNGEQQFESALQSFFSPQAAFVLKAGLAVKPEERIKTVEELLGRLGNAVQGQKPAGMAQQDADITQPVRAQREADKTWLVHSKTDAAVTQPFQPYPGPRPSPSVFPPGGNAARNPGFQQQVAKDKMLMKNECSKKYLIGAGIAFLMMVVFSLFILDPIDYCSDLEIVEATTVILFFYIPLLPFFIVYASSLRNRIAAGSFSVILLFLLFSYADLVAERRNYALYSRNYRGGYERIVDKAQPIAAIIIFLHIVVLPCLLAFLRARSFKKPEKAGGPVQDISVKKPGPKWRKPVIAVGASAVVEIILIILLWPAL